MEHYFAIERNGILIDATARMNLENMMLSKESGQQKPHIV